MGMKGIDDLGDDKGMDFQANPGTARPGWIIA